MIFPNRWSLKDYQLLQNNLYENRDQKYRDFSKKLIFTEYAIIGVRTPILKKIAKEIAKTDILSYFKVSRDTSYEEILLQAFVISSIQDVSLAVQYFNLYIQKIDNWALCDSAVASLKIVKENKELFYLEIKKYLISENLFIVRVGLVLLLNYYIEKDYLDKIFYMVENLKREEYYINMAVAWLLSMCYIRFTKETLSYLKGSSLDLFTYNKTISKICDSYQVNSIEKEKLKKLRKKRKE